MIENPEVESSSMTHVHSNELSYKNYLECTSNELEKTSIINVHEINGDLFKVKDNIHVAYCVSKYP